MVKSMTAIAIDSSIAIDALVLGFVPESFALVAFGSARRITLKWPSCPSFSQRFGRRLPKYGSPHILMSLRGDQSGSATRIKKMSAKPFDLERRLWEAFGRP